MPPRFAEPVRVAPGSAVVASNAVMVILMTLLGMTLALDRFVPITAGGITPTFMLGGLLGVLGYWLGLTEDLLRRLFIWITLFCFWGVISVMANGRTGTLANSGGSLAWLFFMAGVATLCLDKRLWRALLVGLVIGASFLLAVVVWRFARGARILDAGYLQLLGLNRNAVDVSIVWLVAPVLWAPSLRVPRWGRLLFVAAAILWLVSSEGRTGFLALLLTPFIFTLLKQGSAMSRAAKFAIVAVCGAVLYVALTTVSIPGVPAIERISEIDSPNRTESDQIRTLLNEKSLALARKHPITGVGWFLIEGKYDPVIEKGTTPHVRATVLRVSGHNTYYEILATTGVPGAVFYLGAILLTLLAGIRNSWDPDTRALTCGFVIVLFCIAFHTERGSVFALSLVLTITAAARAMRSAPSSANGTGAP